MTHNI